MLFLCHSVALASVVTPCLCHVRHSASRWHTHAAAAHPSSNLRYVTLSVLKYR
jgi:hypothetical protein